MISCAKLAQIGVVLPEPLAPRGDYVPDVVHRGVVYVSGQLLREQSHDHRSGDIGHPI